MPAQSYLQENLPGIHFISKKSGDAGDYDKHRQLYTSMVHYLDGVVGNLMNDTQKRRRFVWDEMGFLQLWWDNQATSEQQAQFKQVSIRTLIFGYTISKLMPFVKIR